MSILCAHEPKACRFNFILFIINISKVPLKSGIAEEYKF